MASFERVSGNSQLPDKYVRVITDNETSIDSQP